MSVTATAAAPSATLRVEPFDVVEKWVRIELEIYEEEACYFEGLPRLEREDVGSKAWWVMMETINALKTASGPLPDDPIIEWLERDRESIEDVSAFPAGSITVVMRQHQWEGMQLVAEYLRMSSCAVVRAGLHEAYHRYRERGRRGRRSKKGG